MNHVFEYSISEEVPILNIGLSGNIPRKEMKIYGEVLKDKIEQMAEIKEVSLRGVQDFEVEVSLDLIKMVAATVSFDDVINCIQRGNNTISASLYNQQLFGIDLVFHHLCTEK